MWPSSLTPARVVVSVLSSISASDLDRELPSRAPAADQTVGLGELLEIERARDRHGEPTLGRHPDHLGERARVGLTGHVRRADATGRERLEVGGPCDRRHLAAVL